LIDRQAFGRSEHLELRKMRKNGDEPLIELCCSFVCAETFDILHIREHAGLQYI
jgi:hypothetical protein